MKKSLKILGAIFAIIVLTVGGFIGINNYLEKQKTAKIIKENEERFEKEYEEKDAYSKKVCYVIPKDLKVERIHAWKYDKHRVYDMSKIVRDKASEIDLKTFRLIDDLMKANSYRLENEEIAKLYAQTKAEFTAILEQIQERETICKEDRYTPRSACRPTGSAYQDPEIFTTIRENVQEFLNKECKDN